MVIRPIAGCPLSHSQQCRSVESDTTREDGREDGIEEAVVKNARGEDGAMGRKMARLEKTAHERWDAIASKY